MVNLVLQRQGCLVREGRQESDRLRGENASGGVGQRQGADRLTPHFQRNGDHRPEAFFPDTLEFPLGERDPRVCEQIRGIDRSAFHDRQACEASSSRQSPPDPFLA